MKTACANWMPSALPMPKNGPTTRPSSLRACAPLPRATSTWPAVTGEVGLDDVATAFDHLGNPEARCKILVVP